MSDENNLNDTRQYWDSAALSFDDEPDHGLRDPLIRAHWTNFLQAHLPHGNATVLDIGCGTGSLSVVLAALGHQVTGIDLSPAMIALAKAKAEKLALRIEFQVMEAAFPQLLPQHYEVIVCRHLLWALPNPKDVLQRWAELLKSPGRLILMEGFWETGAGLHADEVIEMLPASFTQVVLENLSGDSAYWGKTVNDERYAIIAHQAL